jgi:hypothetical protein
LIAQTFISGVKKKNDAQVSEFQFQVEFVQVEGKRVHYFFFIIGKKSSLIEVYNIS